MPAALTDLSKMMFPVYKVASLFVPVAFSFWRKHRVVTVTLDFRESEFRVSETSQHHMNITLPSQCGRKPPRSELDKDKTKQVGIFRDQL